MTGIAEMARDRGVIAVSNVSEVLREPIRQAMSCLTDVQRKTESVRNAVNNVARSTLKESAIR